MRLGRRQLAVLHAAAKGECSMWHHRQGRMTLSVGGLRDGEFFPDSVLDTLFEHHLIRSVEHPRMPNHWDIVLTDAGRAELARREESA